MKTLGELESPEQTRSLFLRCGAGGGKGVFSRHDCIRFIFSLSSTTDCPIFPWSPLTEISSFGGGGGGQTSEASGEALPGGHCYGPSSTAARLNIPWSFWCLPASIQLGSGHTMNEQA